MQRIYDSRITSLIEVTDQVKRYTELNGSLKPPLVKMTPEEVKDVIWRDPKKSFRQQLVEVLDNLQDQMLKIKIMECLDNFSVEESNLDDKEYFEKVRERFWKVFELLSGNISEKIHIDALKDFLLLKIYIRDFYKVSEEYKEVLDGPKVIKNKFNKKIDCTIDQSNEKVIFQRKKGDSKTFLFSVRYKKSYVFDLLVNWFRRDIILSQSCPSEGLGLHSYPKFSSFLFAPTVPPPPPSAPRTSKPGFGSLMSSLLTQKQILPSKIPNGLSLDLTYPSEKYNEREVFFSRWYNAPRDYLSVKEGWDYDENDGIIGSIQMDEAMREGEEGKEGVFRAVLE